MTIDIRPFLFFALVFSCLGFWLYWNWRKKTKRHKLFNHPFPLDWQEFLTQNLPIYQLLPDELKPQLHGHIQVFLAEKTIEGAKDMPIDEAMRLIIAAQACLLLLNRNKPSYFPGLTHIIVYPGSYEVPHKRLVGGVEWVGTEVRLGEAWGQRGLLLLSWETILQDLQLGTGNNLIIHEFTHQLDRESGRWDGTPVLQKKAYYKLWGRVFTSAYNDLRTRIKAHIPTAINTYGATNEAEFFAVVSEAFFDQPWALQDHYPELYETLKLYYQLDPLVWYQESSKKF